MSKQSTITNLLVMPLIASAVFLASPALADNSIGSIHKGARDGVHITTLASGTYQSIVGKVTSINGNIITLESTDNVTYTVDVTNATIMRASPKSNANPSIITASEIKTGDVLMVRGVIDHLD